MMRQLFVTVGTTKFDALIAAVSSAAFYRVAKEIHSIDHIIIQYGSGVEPSMKPLIDTTVYRYKDDIIEDIKKSSIVISHSGSGTILQVLKLKIPLLVVVNESLMDNHQWEIADALSAQNVLKTATPETLLEIFSNFRPSDLLPWRAPDPSPLYKEMGRLAQRPFALKKSKESRTEN